MGLIPSFTGFLFPVRYPFTINKALIFLRTEINDTIYMLIL